MRIAPGSILLAYTLTSTQTVSKMLPPSLELTTSRLLRTDPPPRDPKLLFNIYSVDSGLWMNGMRADVLTLARHRTTRRTHLVVLDCLTDTLRWDPVNGVRGANARFVRPRPREVGVEMHNGRDSLVMRTTRQTLRDIDWTFAVEANLACYFNGVDVPYTMSFNETEIMQPVRILDPIVEITNTFWNGVRLARPTHVFCHDHPMTFDVDVESFSRHDQNT